MVRDRWKVDVHAEIRWFRVCAIGNAIREGTGIGRKESGVEGSRIFGKAVYVTLGAQPFQSFTLAGIR